MKREKKTGLVTVRLPETVRQKLESTASASDRTLSYLVRTALAKSYGEQAETQPQN